MRYTVQVPGLRARNFKHFASANAFFKTGSYGTVFKARNTGKSIVKQASLPLH